MSIYDAVLQSIHEDKLPKLLLSCHRGRGRRPIFTSMSLTLFVLNALYYCTCNISVMVLFYFLERIHAKITKMAWPVPVKCKVNLKSSGHVAWIGVANWPSHYQTPAQN